MIRYCVSTEPEPDQLINELVAGWRERATAQFKERSSALFQQSGIISTEEEYFQKVLDEAERRARLKLFGQSPKTEEESVVETAGRTM